MAEDAVFSFANKSDWTNNSQTVDGITLTWNGASIQNGYVKCKQNNSFAISAEAGKTIVGISLVAKDEQWSLFTVNPSIGTFAADDANYTASWSGSTNSISFVNNEKSNEISITGVTVTYSTSAEPSASLSGAPDGDVNIGTEVVLVAKALNFMASSYQWYSNSTDSNVGGELLSGETGNTYSPSTDEVNIKYYYCVISDGTNDYVTNVARINVIKPVSPYTLPSSCLDLSCPAALLMNKWSNVDRGYYLSKNVLVVDAYAAMKSSSTQMWVGNKATDSDGTAWNEEGVFKGSTYYSTTSNSKKIQTEKYIFFYVTNCSSVSALVKTAGKDNLVVEENVYEVNDGVISVEACATTKTTTKATLETIEVTGLDATKEYIVVIRSIKTDGTASGDNSYCYEVAFTRANVVADYTRSVNTTNFGTLCVPFSFTKPDGMILYDINYKDDYKIYLSEATEIVAGRPYFFKSSEPIVNLYYEGTNATAGNNNGLYGCFDAKLVAQDGNYIIKDNVLYLVNQDDFVCGANRGYIHIADVPNVSSGKADASIDFDETTGIDSRLSMKTSREAIYNLSGTKISNNHKGIVIVAGKKIICK